MIGALLLSLLAVEATPLVRAIPMRGGVLFILPVPEDACAVRSITLIQRHVGPGKVVQEQARTLPGGYSPRPCERRTRIRPRNALTHFIRGTAEPTLRIVYEVEMPNGFWTGEAGLQIDPMPELTATCEGLTASAGLIEHGLRFDLVNGSGKSVLLGDFGSRSYFGGCGSPHVLLSPGESLTVFDTSGRSQLSAPIAVSLFSPPEQCDDLDFIRRTAR